MNNKNNKYDTLIIILSLLMIFMGVGYSILSTTLVINGTAQVAGKWKIAITSVEALENETTAVSTSAQIINSTTASLSTDLIKPGDYMEYKIIVHNQGNIDAKLADIVEYVENKTEYIEFSNNAVINHVLKPDEQMEFVVRVEFPIEIEELNQNSSTYSLVLNYIQN